MLQMGGSTAPIGEMIDRTIQGPAGRMRVRCYRPPATVARLLPAVLFFHGGGWVMGSLEGYDLVCRYFCARTGCAVIAVDYRLAPEHKFPAAVDDAWAATRWVVSHASELGVDGRRIAVAGDSAGGNLAAVVALLARDAADGAIALQVLVYPVTDLSSESKSYNDFAEGYMLTRDSMRWFKNHYLKSAGDAEDWRASPIRAKSLAGLPPALVVTAGFDPLRDEGAAYAARLTEGGVRVDYVCYGGMIHGFVPMGRLIDTGNRAISHVAASLRQALR